MAILLTILFVICPLAALLFVVRLTCSLFSPKISEEIRNYPVTHAVWACFAFGGFLVFIGVLNPAAWPPPSIERRGQREKVLERVQSAGGWATLQKECDNLVEQHRDGLFYWHRGNTNALPPALAALKPWSVEFHSPAALREFKDAPQVNVVRVKIFGMHSTGGHSTPYFGLEIVSGPGATSYRPKPSNGGASGNRYRSFHPIIDRIYEIY